MNVLHQIHEKSIQNQSMRSLCNEFERRQIRVCRNLFEKKNTFTYVMKNKNHCEFEQKTYLNRLQKISEIERSKNIH